MSALVLPIRKSLQSTHAHFWKTQFCSKQSWCCLLALHVKPFWKKMIALCSEYVNWRGSVMKIPKLISLLILLFSVSNAAYIWCNAALFVTILLYCNLVSVRLKQILRCKLFQKCGASLNKMNKQEHFRAFKSIWNKEMGRCVSAGAIHDFLVRKNFNYNPTLNVLRGYRHQFYMWLFSVEFSSSLYSHAWKPQKL